MTCAGIRAELAGYVLGALEPDERDAVAAHLAQCPDCAAEHARLAGLPALLVHADGLEIPDTPPGLEERLLDRVASERGAGQGMQAARRRRLLLDRGAGRRKRAARRRRPPAWARTAAVALAAAALGAGVTAIALDEDPASPPATYALVLSGDGGASARVQLAPGRGGTELHLWVKGLPPGGEAVYEVRCERAGWSASAGTFRADARGRAYVVLTTAARLGEYERVRVVRRSDAADVLAGELQ